MYIRTTLRKLIGTLLAAAVIVIMAFPVVSHAAGDSLESIDINVELNADGSADITQVWKMKRSSGTEAYIPQTQLGDMKIIDFHVTDDTGKEYAFTDNWDTDASLKEKAYRCGFNKTDDGVELCWGLSKYGNRTYTLNYAMTNFVKQYTDNNQGFIIRLVNDQMNPAPKHVKITVEIPSYELTAENAGIWGFGYKGETKFADGKVIAESSGAIKYVNILMRLDEGMITPTAQSDQSFAEVEAKAKKGSSYSNDSDANNGGLFATIGRVMDDYGFFIIALIFMAFSGLIGKLSKGSSASTRRYTFDSKTLPYFRDIPFDGELQPAFYGLECFRQLKNESQIISAFFLRWIKFKFVRVETITKQSFFGGNKTDTSLVLSEAPPIVDPVEKKLYTIMLRAAGGDRILQSKELEHWCSENYTEMEDWYESVRKSGRWHFAEHQMVTMEETTSFFGLIKSHNDVLTEAGKKACLDMLGFKKYLKEYTLVEERNAIEVQLWDDYLIFASLFGIAEEVAKEFQKLNPAYVQISAYYQNNMDTFMMISWLHTMSYASHSGMTAGQSAATASSGGGGFSSFGGGGGFSGGGSGGGVR